MMTATMTPATRIGACEVRFAPEDSFYSAAYPWGLWDGENDEYLEFYPLFSAAEAGAQIHHAESLQEQLGEKVSELSYAKLLELEAFLKTL